MSSTFSCSPQGWPQLIDDLHLSSSSSLTPIQLTSSPLLLQPYLSSRSSTLITHYIGDVYRYNSSGPNLLGSLASFSKTSTSPSDEFHYLCVAPKEKSNILISVTFTPSFLWLHGTFSFFFADTLLHPFQPAGTHSFTSYAVSTAPGCCLKVLFPVASQSDMNSFHTHVFCLSLTTSALEIICHTDSAPQCPVAL